MLIECPYCKAELDAGGDIAEGQHVRCLSCGRKFSYGKTSAPASGESVFEVGYVVGATYRIVRLIGEGGMGAVYEVEDVNLGKRFAMKVFRLSEDGSHDPLLRQKFAEEAKQLARLDHKNIARVTHLGFDERSGTPYFVMDLIVYVGGEPCTLADVDSAKIDERLIFQWFSEMCQVLDYVHGQGIVHRDIKLENILLDAQQHIVLTDFGVSRIVGDGMRRVVARGCEVAGLEDDGFIFGTPHYIPPEVMQGADASAKTDVYALGVMFFRLLTGVWYDRQTGEFERLVGRKYRWGPVLRKLLSSAENRPTVLAGFPRELSEHVTPGGRHVGAWKIEIAGQDKKIRLREAVAKAQSHLEGQARRRRNVSGLIVLAVVAGCALCVWPVLNLIEKRQAEAAARLVRANEERERARRTSELAEAAERERVSSRAEKVKTLFEERRPGWQEICESHVNFRQEVELVRQLEREILQSPAYRSRSFLQRDEETEQICKVAVRIQELADLIVRENRARQELDRLSATCQKQLDRLRQSRDVAQYAADLLSQASAKYDEAVKAESVSGRCCEAFESMKEAGELLRKTVERAEREARKSRQMVEQRRAKAAEELQELESFASAMFERVRVPGRMRSVREQFQDLCRGLVTPKDCPDYVPIAESTNRTERELRLMTDSLDLFRNSSGRTVRFDGRNYKTGWDDRSYTLVLKADSLERSWSLCTELLAHKSGDLNKILDSLVGENAKNAPEFYLGIALLMKVPGASYPPDRSPFVRKCIRIASARDSLGEIISREFPGFSR